MKRINILLSNELADSVEQLANKKEMSVAEIARRSLELYLQRVPLGASVAKRLPTFDLGKPLKRDFKKVIYETRNKEVVD